MEKPIMRKTSLLLIAVSALTLAAPAMAHRQWLLPSGTTFAGVNEWVAVDAAVSNDLFYADHMPLRVDGVKVWAPDGTPGEISNPALSHFRSTFDVKLDKPGTWKIGTMSSGVMGSFKVDGVEWRVGGRGGPPAGGAQGELAGGPRPAASPAPMTAAPGGPASPPRLSVPTVADLPAKATDIQLIETSNRNEIFVTAGAPTTNVLKPTGKGLEFVPISHPDELVANEPARFAFLVDGKPAANLKVTVVPGGKRYRDAEGAFDVTTGSDGVITVKWPAAGMYWLNASLTDGKATMPRATQRRMSYTSTLEVAAP
jgi:hypothetical protein